MQIPETPPSVDQLDLMRRLKDYSDGNASWTPDVVHIGESERKECRDLHANIGRIIDKMLLPLLGRVNAREMESFTMHDRTHSLKVAHLMWHILNPCRRETLTPPEIALLVLSAFLHDLGMALSSNEREARLHPDSDLWEKLQLDEHLKEAIQELTEQASDSKLPDAQRERVRRRLAQAEEVLLCQDTRERHATRERYRELLAQLDKFHVEDPVNLPDVDSCLAFGGDSFRDKLIEICASHGEEVDFLLENDEANIERHRFPHDYILGSCTADLHMVAGALRLADILDFDRERTPPVLYYYLLPTNLAPQEDKSVLEWCKHLVISNWRIDPDAIIFQGHCRSHIIHHTVSQFCSAIENEIRSTLETFVVRKIDIPFVLPKTVRERIEPHGYTYVPYKFELDDHRVYALLMGGQIYDRSLVAVRELVQNAVDACSLRDAMTALHDPNAKPSDKDRITITYTEPTPDCAQPTLTVTDTGTGMDRWLLENYFLRVGRSYYNSADFNKIRLQLRAKSEELDFAPVSEFGIGFLSCFLLADRLEVTTAMWEAVRGETVKRRLIIDGPTRLIRLSEQRNDGLDRFRGTSVKLYLTRGSEEGDETRAPAWIEITKYLRKVCQDLPYKLTLEHISGTSRVLDYVDAPALRAAVPPELEGCTYRVPVDDREYGLEGEIAIVNILRAKQERLLPTAGAFRAGWDPVDDVLIRGGFFIGRCPGLPDARGIIGYARLTPSARIRLKWQPRKTRRYVSPKLSRNATSEEEEVARHIVRAWLGHLLDQTDKVPKGLLHGYSFHQYVPRHWLTFLQRYGAHGVYRFAKSGWEDWLQSCDDPSGKATVAMWEGGGTSSVRYSPNSLDICFQLLDLVLPRITSLQLETTPEHVGYLVKPPVLNWEVVLHNWPDFIEQSADWPQFIEFVGPNRNLLYMSEDARLHGFKMNALYEDELNRHFSPRELRSLPQLLGTLAASRGPMYQLLLPSWFIRDMKNTQDKIGHLQIGNSDEAWPISSFDIPHVPDI